MLLFLFRLLACVPLPLLHGVGRIGGRIVYALPGKYRRRLRDNARQAGYSDAVFARRAAAQTGAMIMELPKVWLRTEQCLDKIIAGDDDMAIVADAVAQGRGVLCLTPHLGGFEIAARYMAAVHGPMTVMFRPPRKNMLRPIMEQGRNSATLNAVPANMKGVREFVRALRRGGVVGLLPDQAPSSGEGVWVPFFGRPAYTMTLPGKLAAQTHVPVIAAAGERLPHGRGWRIHVVRLPEPLPADPDHQAALVNQTMEALIRRMPDQYLWGYNRYKQPKGAPPPPPST
ncbi:MAG TPA: lysophospholipid acyltransferase family protein [Burkholderiaceae bacterium]|nr:lysophospholipid acyltransferase family protein [Burkholderiaceae bacterium]